MFNVSGTGSRGSQDTSITSKDDALSINPTILAYSELDEKMQKIALHAIAEINKKTSTMLDKTWENYTPQIIERLRSCENAKNTLFVAIEAEKVAIEVKKVIGYVVFYTQPDQLRYSNCFLYSETEAYCSWTAVDEDYRGKGLALDLKLKIFDSGKYDAFKGHIKETNKSSLRVLEKFKQRGFNVSSVQQAHQVFYTVSKKE